MSLILTALKLILISSELLRLAFLRDGIFVSQMRAKPA